MHVFRQGDLDGLCGAYSVVNAARVVAGLDAEQSATLFETIVRYVGDARRVTAGIGRGLMDDILRDIGSTYLPSRYMPFRNRAGVPLPVFWDTVSDFLAENPTRAAILCIDTPTAHWTTAVRLTDRRMQLVDSDGLNGLRRSRCTTGPATAARPFRIWPTHTYLIG